MKFSCVLCTVGIVTMYYSCVLWVKCLCTVAVYCGTVTMHSSCVLWVQQQCSVAVYCGYSNNVL